MYIPLLVQLLIGLLEKEGKKVNRCVNSFVLSVFLLLYIEVSVMIFDINILEETFGSNTYDTT